MVQAPQVVGIASDHGGLNLRRQIATRLSNWGYAVLDLGPATADSCDYPDFATSVVEGVLAGRFSRGILICGTGLGMAMAANRRRGIRAAVCTSAYMARMSRAHNDANVLCLGERVIGIGEAEDILKTFLETPFEGGRHIARIAKLDP